MKIDDEMYNEIFSEEEQKKETITVNDGVAVSCIYDWVSSIIISVVLVVAILTYCFRIIDVDGTSMESTLINTDKVFVTDLFYTPKSQDVIVISHGEEYKSPLIKRVIATEGQTLKIDFNTGNVFVDGVLLDEKYIQGNTVKGNAEIPAVVPAGKVFVMGDNRSVSLDSRYHEVGLIDVTSIIGKAQYVIIPHKYADDGITPVLDFSKIRYIYD